MNIILIILNLSKMTKNQIPEESILYKEAKVNRHNIFHN